MKARKAKDLRELNDKELQATLKEARETLARQGFQHQLKQLQDTSYLGVLRSDIARINTIIQERKIIANTK